MFLNKLEQGVKVTRLSVLLLFLPILKEDQCWVAMHTVTATEVPLHGAVHLECVLFHFWRKGNVVDRQTLITVLHTQPQHVICNLIPTTLAIDLQYKQ